MHVHIHDISVLLSGDTLSWDQPALWMVFFVSLSITRFITEASFGLWDCHCLLLSVCACVSVCLSVNHLFVHAITQDSFKLGSPNLDQRCKKTLRSLLFCGLIDLDLQGQIEPQSPNLSHLELHRTITHHPFKLGSPNLDQRCKIPWLRSLLTVSQSQHVARILI